MSQREKDVWRDIFELYRDLPCLWKTNHDHYHNKDMRSQAMSLLHEKYKIFDEDATLAVFKKKLENMRTSYGRERKKVMNSTQTGASIDDVYVPTLWYYELLTFLDEKDTAARNGVDTAVSADEDCNSEAPPAVKRKKVSSFQKKQEQLLDTTNKILNAKEDDWEIIGRSIGVQLRDLTANQKVIARKLISDVIFYGSTEQLTNNSFISIPSSSIIPSPSPQYEYNENQYILPSPLPPTSGNTSHSLNHPKIIIKRPPKPSSTSIETQLYAASPSSANSPQITNTNFGTISQDDRHNYGDHEELSRNMSPLPPASGNTSHSLNHPKIIIKRPPKPSSTSIETQQYAASPSSANSPQITNTNFGTISQDDRHNYGYHEELSRNMSPLPPASGNTSHSLNHPKIIIKRPPKTSSTPIGSQQYVASPLFANSPQITNNSLCAISQDDSLDYVNDKQSSVIYEGKGSQLGQFLLYNKKHEN